MSVRIDEAGKNDPAPPVNHFNVVRQGPRHVLRVADSGDHAVNHQHPAIFDDRQVAQLSAHSGTLRTGEGEQLPGMQKCDGIHTEKCAVDI
jgi:hypothetical protein